MSLTPASLTVPPLEVLIAMPDLTGKVALISGGGSGIGAATAHRLFADGARVAVLGRRGDRVDAVAAAVDGLAIVADAADSASAHAAVARVIEHFGSLDVLIANAGGGGMGTILDTDEAAWEQALLTNLETTVTLTRAALPALIRARGTVVVISSLAGLFAPPAAFGYTTAKHALVGLTRSIARDYGPQGVRANLVCPGWTHTEAMDEALGMFAVAGGISPVRAMELATADIPLGRAALPGEVASVCAFLASTDAAMVTGTSLVVDGGASALDPASLSLFRAASSD